MTLEEIKQAVDSGNTVNWSNHSYEVIKDSFGQYLINFGPTGFCISLSGQDGTEYENVLNGSPEDFYIGKAA